MATKKSSGSGRTRNYATVVYPESAPNDWLSILGECCIPCFVSPLHDLDIDPGNQPKKPHYHVMLMFDGVKTREQAQEVFDQIGGVGCEIVQSIRGYARYLCHLDNPEKHQYDPEAVTAFGGADYHSVIGLAIDRYVAIGDMIDFCEENDVVSYADLLKWCRFNKMEWFRVLCDNGTFVMREYLKSKRWCDRSMESSERFDSDPQPDEDDD